MLRASRESQGSLDPTVLCPDPQIVISPFLMVLIIGHPSFLEKHPAGFRTTDSVVGGAAQPSKTC